MHRIKKIIFAAIFGFMCVSPIAGYSAATECMEYTDCDMMAGCELLQQIESAASGLAANYNQAIANVIVANSACKNYADKFKKDLEFPVKTSNNTEIKVAISWAEVKKLVQNTPASQQQSNNNSEYAPDADIIAHIVDILGPDTQEQKAFFEALAKSYLAANRRDNTSRLDDAFVLNFLGDNNNFDKYKKPVSELTGSVKDEETGIDINWDDVLIEISQVLDQTMQKRGAMVCENNRSWEVAIDSIGWIVTAVAAIFTFYTGGAGGAAVAAGRAAIGAGLKVAAKAVAKVGGKAAAKRMAKQGGKQLAKAAIKLGLKANMRGWANYAGRGVLKAGVKNFVKKAGANLATKQGILLAAGSLVWPVGKAAIKSSAAGTLYSLVESSPQKDFVNCQDLDHNEGCYTVCGDSGASDDLNTKVFKPILGKTYCVNESDYMLYEIKSGGGRGAPLQTDVNKWKQIQKKIKSSVADKGKCDWNEDDIDMYAGFFIHDPDTLDVSHDGLVIDEIIRLDD